MSRRWKRPRVEYRRENFLRPPTSFKGAWTDEMGRKYILGARGDGKNWKYVDSALIPDDAIIAYVRIRGEQTWVQEGDVVVLKMTEDIVRRLNGRTIIIKKDETKKKKFGVFKMFIGDARKKTRACILEPIT